MRGAGVPICATREMIGDRERKGAPIAILLIPPRKLRTNRPPQKRKEERP